MTPSSSGRRTGRLKAANPRRGGALAAVRNTGVDVVADRAGGVRKHARQVESVTDVQCGPDFIGVLGQQQLPAAPGHPVQLCAHVEQRQMRLAQRACRRGQRSGSGIMDVGELRDRQGVEQLHVAQAAHDRISGSGSARWAI